MPLKRKFLLCAANKSGKYVITVIQFLAMVGVLKNAHLPGIDGWVYCVCGAALIACICFDLHIVYERANNAEQALNELKQKLDAEISIRRLSRY